MVEPNEAPPSYRICVIRPEGYPHYRCFDEVADLLRSSLRSIGLNTEIVYNACDPHSINIVLGYHLVTNNDLLAGCRYIPYQLEQFGAKAADLNEPSFLNQRNILQGAETVWDYSLENIKLLEAHGIKTKYLPLGYHPALERIQLSTRQDIDVLFYGSINDRREYILKQLKEKSNLSVKVLFGVYGKERDSFVARSKIVLNLHYYPTQVLELPRIFYLLNNQCFVLSETSAVNAYQKINLPLVSYDQLVESCLYYLGSNDVRERIRLQNYLEFKEHYPMEGLLRSVT